MAYSASVIIPSLLIMSVTPDNNYHYYIILHHITSPCTSESTENNLLFGLKPVDFLLIGVVIYLLGLR